MLLDKASPPDTLWGEDEDGNKIPYNIDVFNGKGFFPKYQHGEIVLVVHSVCGVHKDPKWPIRFLKWICDKMPSSWHESPAQIYRTEKTINCLYPIVKYLVEKRDFSFNNACVLASNLCESCMNLCLIELEGGDINRYQRPNTSCKYCEIIDTDYSEKRRVEGCYNAYWNNKVDVSDAYKRGFCYYHKKHCPPVFWSGLKKETLFQKIKRTLKWKSR